MLTPTLTGRALRAGLFLSTPCLALACALESASPSTPTGAGAAAGTGGAGGSGAAGGTAGSNTTGGTAGSTGGSGATGGDGGASGSPSGGAGGAPGGTGGAPPQAGTGGNDAMAGTGALGGTAGTSASGGAGSGGDGGTAGASGFGGEMSASGGTAGSAGGSAGAPSSTCPAGASFCADFEGAGIPMGASYQPTYQAAMWADFIAFDGTQKHSGNQALMVKPTGSDGYSYRILSVPAPAPSFWVRLYVRSDVDLGQPDHNAFFGASTGTGDQNSGEIMEVAEQYCQVVMNLKDDVVLSIGGATMCGSGGKLLAKDTWHCMEANFDGPNGNVQVFSDNMPIIDKSGWTPKTFQTFVFGFIGFHGPSRTMWYDDVAVGTTRIGCP